jgi:hypothetical protein
MVCEPNLTDKSLPTGETPKKGEVERLSDHDGTTGQEIKKSLDEPEVSGVTEGLFQKVRQLFGRLFFESRGEAKSKV